MTRQYYAQITNFNFSPEGILSGLGTIALFAAGVLCVVFIALSVILEHHWKEHGVTKEQISRLRRIYFGGAGVLFIVMLVSLISFLI